ncbi:MAG: glycosyltransferase family 2 protein [Cytophaga sp.]|uniref:glycosyltransferase family 2 protein n=1 Tax=Cytophaga sp. TaxID=29535 RepID=UPI003F7EA1E9
MLRNTKNNLRIITLKTISIFTAHGRNKQGKFSFWYFIRFCFSNIGFRLFFKYSIESLSILFNKNFTFLKSLVNPKLEKLNITIFPNQYDIATEIKKIHFPKTDSPKVSIIICVYNNIAFTCNCLRAIMEHTGPEVSYEVIVINDFSSDETAELLSKVPNLRLHNNNHNSGFVLSCNQGASLAKGNYLCFLNNDTVVQKQWLTSMIELIESDNQIGIVGSKLVFGDGDLQEAGGIVWQDGQTYHYGRRGSISNKKYNYIREVDYCSGASFLISKADFEQLKGFDEMYTPGYYEDTDLCFSIKYTLNKKVVYQPASIVVHYEGVTSGTNMNAGMRRYQQINAQKFKDKWKKQLQSKLPNSFMNLDDTLVKYQNTENAKLI